MSQPGHCGLQRFFPLNFLELTAAARPDPAQRLHEFGRGFVVHDPGRTLCAKYSLVHRMAAVALDVANLAVLEMNFDATAAGAHVAGRLGNFVTNARRGVD